jgi:hypothetical protein
MEVQELIAGARDAVSVTRVYGDPYEKNGLTVIPAATVRGGGGAGQGEKEGAETGTGGGFGLTARPAGAWIIEGGHADWKPAIDVNRVVAGGQVIALVAIVVSGRILLTHSRRRQPLHDLISRRREARRPKLHLLGRRHA